MKNKKIDIESLEKKNIQQVPDGYFDELPLKIQSRISEQQKAHSPLFITKMQIAWSMTAVIAIFLVGWILYPSKNNSSAEQLLASIDSEDLIEYLYEEDISTDEILASLDVSYYSEELNSLETEFIDENLSSEDLESMYLELDYSTEIM